MLDKLFCAELRRRCPHERVPNCEEKDLVIAILGQAFADSILPDDSATEVFALADRGRAGHKVKIRMKVKQDALGLFNSHRLNVFARILELTPDEIRKCREDVLGPRVAAAIKAGLEWAKDRNRSFARAPALQAA